MSDKPLPDSLAKLRRIQFTKERPASPEESRSKDIEFGVRSLDDLVERAAMKIRQTSPAGKAASPRSRPTPKRK